jgi:hypothetical protein
MKYAVEIGSGAMIYIPSFINTGSGIQKLIQKIYGHRDTHRQQGDLVSLMLVLAYFPKVGLCILHLVCLFVFPPTSSFEFLNQSL